MTISLFVILSIYLVCVLVVVIFIFINILHLSRGASLTMGSFIVTLGVFFTVAVVLWGTVWILRDVDWQTQVFSTNDASELFELR